MENPISRRLSHHKNPDAKHGRIKKHDKLSLRIMKSIAAGVFAFGFITACNSPQAASPTLSPDIVAAARQTMTASTSLPQETSVAAVPVLPTKAVVAVPQATEIKPSAPVLPTATPLISTEWPWSNSGSSEEWLVSNLERVKSEINFSGYPEASRVISADLLQAEASLVTRSKEGKLYGGTVTQIAYDTNTGTAFFITVGHIGEDFFAKNQANNLKKIELRQPHLGRTINVSLQDIAVYVDLPSDLAMFAVHMPAQITTTTSQFALDTCNNPVSYSGSLAAFGFPYVNKTYAPYFSQGTKDTGCFLYKSKPYLSTTTATYEGMSGAPIVNSTGQIIGFVDGATPNGTAALTVPSSQLIEDMKLLSQAALR